MIVPALCFVYLLLPGHPLAMLDGVPFGALELSLAVGLSIALFGLGPVPSARGVLPLTIVLVVLAIVKVGLAWSAPTYGLGASYYPRARIGGAPERSTELRGAAYTRVEAGFGGVAFATHFFNDVERFNFYEPDQPDRRGLPFAVAWDGFLHVPDDGTYPIELRASGAAALVLDGRPVLTVSAADGRPDRTALALTRGSHAIRVEYTRPDGRVPSLSLDWDPGDGMRPVQAPDLTVEPTSSEQRARDRIRRVAAAATDVGFFVMLLVLVASLVHSRVRDWAHSWERPLLSAFLAAVLAHALATTGDLYRRAVILEGGQDWLTYESYARDILLNGPLMTLGKPIGQGKPFFFQPFYPYYLAATHWLTGEDLWGPIVLQLVGLGVVGVLIYHLAARLFDSTAALLSLSLFVILQAAQLDWVARKLLSENLYFILLPAAVLLLVRVADAGRRRDALFGGLFLGLASITRAPTLLYVVPAALVIWLILRCRGAGDRSALGTAAIILVVTAAVAAFVPVRNYVVSGRPALVATNGGATLLLAHTPTPTVRLARVDDNRFYNLLNLDRQTREVLEFVRQDPLGYAATLVPLALYTVGFSGAIDGSNAVAPEILALTALYLGAFAWLPGARGLRAGLLHLFIAIHFAVMVTFLPYVYGYRQVLPMHLLMLVIGAGLIAGVGQRLQRRARATLISPHSPR